MPVTAVQTAPTKPQPLYRRPETWVFALYVALTAVLICFHEPWFDEVQAWLIARDAPLHDILFVIPHYEGHPPLWHLLLAVPARLGVPYEVGLKTVNLLTAYWLVWLIEFRSPFSKPAKAVLPFTYFLFYQYAIVSRPYALLGAALMLAAIFFKERETKPGRFVAALVLLCLTSAFGIVLACGIAAAWVLELVVREKKRVFGWLKAHKAVVLWLAVLVAVGLALALEIMPEKDTYATNRPATEQTYPLAARVLLYLFFLPSEAVVTSFSEYVLLSEQHYALWELVYGVVISLLIWAALFLFCRKRHVLPYLLVPYVITADSLDLLLDTGLYVMGDDGYLAAP